MRYVSERIMIPPQQQGLLIAKDYLILFRVNFLLSQAIFVHFDTLWLVISGSGAADIGALSILSLKFAVAHSGHDRSFITPI